MFNYTECASVEIIGGESFPVYSLTFHAADVRDYLDRADLDAATCDEIARAFLDYITDYAGVREQLATTAADEL